MSPALISRALKRAAVFLAACLFLKAAAAAEPPRWKILHEETFSFPFNSNDFPWTREARHAEDPLSDDGAYFHIIGGAAFERQIKTFEILRKRVAFGSDGWLTLELAARARPGRRGPKNAPRFQTRPVRGRDGLAGWMVEPSHQGGIIIRNTEPLPPVYRIEYELVAVNFGGSRAGDWKAGGKINGYGGRGYKTNHPWPWAAGDIFEKPEAKWPDVRDYNGFYYLAIVDYADPAPHNNVFIHTHRKVAMDSYNVPNGNFDACDPASKNFYKGQDHVVDAFFAVPGTPLDSRAVMETECGTVVGGEDGRTGYVGAAQLRPELMPGETYTFAIERDEASYTLEMSGNFVSAGKRTFRYTRSFVQDGLPIWHYNQSPDEYDGEFNEDWAYEGPFGELARESWPAGSAYPDFFIIGDPHINYYEGTAAIDNVRLMVPD